MFALNEVTVFLPSAIAVAQAAHAAGLKAGCLTNGCQTQEAAELLAQHMDYINVSVKSLDDAFIRNTLQLPGASPIRRNLRLFAQHTHLEVVTPLVKEIMGQDVDNILDCLADIDPEIPWHLFRLLPTHDRAKEQELDHGDMLALLERARRKLPFTYLGNFAGSQWVDTHCPDCGHTLIKRLAVGAWNSRVLNVDLQGDRCPNCGRAIPIVL